MIVLGLFFFWKSEDFVTNKANKESLRQQIKLAQQDMFLDVQYEKLVNIATLNAEYYDRKINRYIEIQYEDDEADLIGFIERVYNKHFIGVCAKKDKFTPSEIKKFRNSFKSHILFKRKGDVLRQNPLGVEAPYSCLMVMNNKFISTDLSKFTSNMVEYALWGVVDSQKTK